MKKELENLKKNNYRSAFILRKTFYLLTLLSVFFVFTQNSSSYADQTYTSSGGNNVGTVTSCSDVVVPSGNGFSGGAAGFEGAGNACASGGGQTFCADTSAFNFSYECAGAVIPASGAGYEIAWPSFDMDAETMQAIKVDLESNDPAVVQAAKDALEIFYSSTTRDITRGRAGDNSPLFVNEHGICRMIDKTSTSSGGAAAANLNPLFMGFSTAEEWRTVHGVPGGGNPNGGNTSFPNQPDVDLEVCCSPQFVSICGQQVGTGYAPVGVSVYVFARSGAAKVDCVGNNTWNVSRVSGICNGGGGGDSFSSSGGGGYSNPGTGGQISSSDWGGMSAEAQSSLSEDGYGPDSSANETNSVGEAAMDAAEAAADAAEAEAQAEADAAQAAAEAAEAAAEAAEEAAQDDDDD